MQNLKTKLLNACREVQLKTIDNLKKTVEDAQKSANEYGAPKDRYDSFRTQMLRKKDMFAKHLQQANEQLDVLQKIDLDHSFTKVEFGALVTTEKQKLFISIGIGKVVMENFEFYAISPVVPIYKVMKGLKVGDEFEFNGVSHRILEII